MSYVAVVRKEDNSNLAVENDLKHLAQTKANLSLQMARIEAKLKTARSEIELRDQLHHEHNVVIGKINKAKAIAFVEGSTAVLGALEANLKQASGSLKKAEIEAASAGEAITILTKKAAENSDLMRAIEDDIVNAERNWLKAKQKLLFEEFRSRFHELHDTIALLLALEVHPSFDPPDSLFRLRLGSDLLSKLAAALPYKGPLNYSPGWVHENNRLAFPGFGEAQKKLADALSQTTLLQEQAP